MSKEVLAVVAGKEITKEDLDAFLANAPKEHQPYLSNPALRQRYLEQLVELTLFAKLGEEQKLNETERFIKVIENAKCDILAQMAVTETLKNVTATDDEVKGYYEANTQRFQKPETVRAKHILVADEDTCNEIKKALDENTKTFEDAASEFSTCPSKERGGDLGEFGRGQMVKEFEDAAFAAELNTVVGPVKTQFGYHLIQVTEKHKPETASFETVKDTIRKNLIQMKQNDVYAAKIKELKEKYNVTISEEM